MCGMKWMVATVPEMSTRVHEKRIRWWQRLREMTSRHGELAHHMTKLRNIVYSAVAPLAVDGVVLLTRCGLFLVPFHQILFTYQSSLVKSSPRVDYIFFLITCIHQVRSRSRFPIFHSKQQRENNSLYCILAVWHTANGKCAAPPTNTKFVSKLSILKRQDRETKMEEDNETKTIRVQREAKQREEWLICHKKLIDFKFNVS